MPTYTYECPKDGTFELTLPLRKWDDHKRCPKCKEMSEQVLIPSRGDAHFEVPIVVHVDASGKFSFPAHQDAPVREGYEKKELRSIREVEAFERKVNARLSRESAEHNAREEALLSSVLDKNRKELRTAMERMSPAGRTFAEFAIRMNNERKRKTSEVGFHTVILHFDESNRDAYRDRETNWKSRR